MSTCTQTQRATASVHSNRSSSDNDLVFHVVRRVRLADWVSARGSVVVTGSTGAISVTAAVRYGDDDAALDAATPTAMGAAQVNDGATYGTLYGTLNDDFQLAEFGFNVKNSTGTDLELATATLILDLRK